MTKEQTLKAKAIKYLKIRVPEYEDKLRAIDDRLYDYYDGLISHSSIDPADHNDQHNLYELLGALKLLRLLGAYIINLKRIHHVIAFYEGQWENVQGNIWKYVEGSGGFLFSGIFGRQHYRLTPVQVFMLAGVFTPYYWFDTGYYVGEREMLPSERGNNGKIYDFRRLCIEAFYFIPRKFGKTTVGAFFQAYNFYWGDPNSEGYCLANSQAQSKILFDMAYDLIHQLDPNERAIRFTTTQINWRRGQERSASITSLSAGGKTKDGYFAQICSADEFGASEFVNGKSDMESLINVIEGSMGPRRERLTVHTTTAGLTANGPCQRRIETIEKELKREIAFYEGKEKPTINDDKYFYLILEPDKWQLNREEVFTNQSIWKKVNPHIGLTVQPDYYEAEIDKSIKAGERKVKETVAKMFNIFESGNTEEWVTPARIRTMQRERRIMDCPTEDGWVVFCGMDFSQGNDLHASTYLASRWDDERQRVKYFADIDAWINEETLRKSSIRGLYEQWIEQGWLRLSEGEVFQPNLLTQRIRELDSENHVDFMAFGYDSHLSRDPINELCAWLQTIGITDPSKMVIPVSQTYGAFNQSVDRLTLLLKEKDSPLTFSNSPLWPWQFGNTVLDEDVRMGNKKPIKRTPGSDACKIDNVICLCEAFILEEQFNI